MHLLHRQGFGKEIDDNLTLLLQGMTLAKLIVAGWLLDVLFILPFRLEFVLVSRCFLKVIAFFLGHRSPQLYHTVALRIGLDLVRLYKVENAVEAAVRDVSFL